MDFYYHGAWRMDWGFGNPNKTAALITCLMLSVWSAAYIWRRGFWLALPIFTALAWCLVQTYSRGGILALIGGLIVLLAWSPRPWPRARLIAGLAVTWIIIVFILYSRAGTRYGQGLFGDDPSIDSRFVLWSRFPEMLAAAPRGCGWGRAGDVYTQWFQPLDQSENFLNLINSHLTWMAEGGWGFAAFYMWAWMIVLTLCCPGPGSRFQAVPLAVWVAFGISSSFSHVENSPELWIVPCVLLMRVLLDRIRLHRWPPFPMIGTSGLVSAGVVALVILAGRSWAQLPITMNDRMTVLGRGANMDVIFVDRNVLGKLYGHALRKFLFDRVDRAAEMKIIVTEFADSSMPAPIRRTVVSGGLMADEAIMPALNRSDRIILINPGAFPTRRAWDPGLASKTTLYFGEYSDSTSRSVWAGCAVARLDVIPGAADFVPSWPAAVWRPAGT
jgi:hypothetical protein